MWERENSSLEKKYKSDKPIFEIRDDLIINLTSTSAHHASEDHLKEAILLSTNEQNMSFPAHYYTLPPVSTDFTNSRLKSFSTSLGLSLDEYIDW